VGKLACAILAAGQEPRHAALAEAQRGVTAAGHHSAYDYYRYRRSRNDPEGPHIPLRGHK